MFKKYCRLVSAVSTETHDHYDCDACTWEGIDVPKGNREQALEAFANHDCLRYVHAPNVRP